MYRGTKIGITEDFLWEIMHAEREWDSIIKVLKTKQNKTINLELFSQRKSFRNESEIKTFSDIQ